MGVTGSTTTAADAAREPGAPAPGAGPAVPGGSIPGARPTRPGPAAADAAGPPPVDVDRLRERLGARARAHGVPGAQLVVHHAGRTAEIEVGELEHGTERRVDRAAAFPVGSISKTFVASVAMILAADGDVELDAPVGEQLPELDDLPEQPTLRQVLSHTGGFASGPGPERVGAASLRRYVAEHCRRHNLVLPPGTGFSYSNTGYVLVGRLIETVTGMGWQEAVESVLLRPLGIVAAFVGADEAGSPARAIATGHSVHARTHRIRPVHQSLPAAEAPAGALAVSAADLVSLGLMHVGAGVAGLLPPAAAEEMRRPVPAAEPVGLADAWGLGLAVFREGGTEWVGHDGNADGTSCHLRVDPSGGWVIGFTSNATTGSGLWRDVLDELARMDVPLGRRDRPAPPRPPADPPAGCVGTYVNGDDEYVLAAEENGQLRLVVDGDAAPLVVHADLTFSVQDPASGRQVFGGCLLRDPATGAFDGIQVSGRFARRRARSPRRVA